MIVQMRGFHNSWITLVLYNCWISFAKSQNQDGCRDTEFLTCVIPLRIQRVPFDQNLLNVVFNITSEAKLQHTCRAYTDALPCFRDKILRCGNNKQQRMLSEVKKMLTFFCSPESTSKQKEFLKHTDCLGKVMMSPLNTNCFFETHPLAKKLSICRQQCERSKEFICMMEVWVSEQSLCALVDIQLQCGIEAANFYTDLQTNVFTPDYPIVCKAPGYSADSDVMANGNSIVELTTIQSTTTSAAGHIVFSNFIFETTTPKANMFETLNDQPITPPTFNSSYRTSLPSAIQITKPTPTNSKPLPSVFGMVKITSDRDNIGVKVDKTKDNEKLKQRSSGCQLRFTLLSSLISLFMAVRIN